MDSGLIWSVIWTGNCFGRLPRHKIWGLEQPALWGRNSQGNILFEKEAGEKETYLANENTCHLLCFYICGLSHHHLDVEQVPSGRKWNDSLIVRPLIFSSVQSQLGALGFYLEELKSELSKPVKQQVSHSKIINICFKFLEYLWMPNDNSYTQGSQSLNIYKRMRK